MCIYKDIHLLLEKYSLYNFSGENEAIAVIIVTKEVYIDK